MSIATLSRAAAALPLCAAMLLVAVTEPVRAEIPDLAVSKQVVSADETIHAGELIRYVTGLHFTGAEDKAFSIVEVIREPLRVRGTVELTVQAGQVSTRRVSVETRRNSDGINETVVRWRGTMTGGESRIQLNIPVRAEVACRPGQARVPRQSVAGIAVLDGSGLRTSISRDYSVECPPMASVDDIEVDLSLEFPDEEAGTRVNNLRVGGNHDRYANQVVLHATLTNHGNVQAALGVILGVRPTASEPPDTSARYAPILLQPGETRTLDVWTDMRPYTQQGQPPTTRAANRDAGVMELEAGVHYVLLSPLRAGEESVRPHPSANIHAVTRPLRLRAWDLGDAPTSTNRFDTPMEAYPGVPANFPTVFDVSTGEAPGPAHARPRLLHLGRSFSLEADADLGPDASILPTSNRADLDDFDDGTQPSSWNLGHCQFTLIEVQVFISREAVAWFSTQQQTAYLNAWLDMDRNGQWSATLPCPDGDSPEHIIIDHPVDIAALGPGYHALRVPTGRIHWPPELAQQPAWARFTLSEETSVKTAISGSVEHGDGRGPGYPWLFGETEDYLLRPPGSAGAGPDIEVDLHGSSRVIAATDVSPSESMQIEWTWIMDYANIGTQRALGVKRAFRFPEFINLEQVENGATFSRVVQGRDGQTTYHRLTPAQYSLVNNEVIEGMFTKIDLAPGERGQLIVHFRPELGDEVIIGGVSPQEPLDWTVHARAIAPGDINPDNREASFSEVSGLGVLGAWPQRPRIAGRSPTSPFWVPRGTTNQSELTLRGILPTGETALFLTADGDYYEAPIADEGFVNFWLQVIASSTEGSSSDSAMPWRASASDGGQIIFPEYLAPGVYVEEVSFQADGNWELQLTNLPDAHYRIAVGDPRGCDNVTAGLGGDEIAWILNGRPMISSPRELPGASGRRGVALSGCAHFTVDSSLPIDPISLGFYELQAGGVIDPGLQQKVILPNTLGFSRGNWSVRLPPSKVDTEYVAVFALDQSLGNLEPRLIDRYGDQQREITAFETNLPGFYRTEGFLFDEADAMFGSRNPNRLPTTGEVPPPIRDLIIELPIGDMDQAFAGRVDVARRGRVWKAPAGLDARFSSDVHIELLVGVPLKGEMLFVPWNGEPYGQSRTQLVLDGEGAPLTFDYSVPGGVFQLIARADGYQPYRSRPFFGNGPIEREIMLQPQSQQFPARVIMIEDQGLSPAWTDIPPGTTLRVVNTGTRALILGVDDFQQEQRTTSARGVEEPELPPPWRSGQLMSGDTIDLVVGGEEGLLIIRDLIDPNRSMEIQIAHPGDQIFRDRFNW